MLENIDLSRRVGKGEYKAVKGELDLRLAALQRRAKELDIPVVIVFEGWNAAGKGTLINELILPLDPRGFNVRSTHAPNEEEFLRPFLWRFWRHTPARGRIAIFDRSWYRRVLAERVEGPVKGKALQQAFEDIRNFERQLAEDGNVIIKLFLHISKDEQRRRLRKLRDSKSTAWRVTRADLRSQRLYDRYLLAADDMLAETDSENGPWTVVEAEDQRFATLKIFGTVIEALQGAVERSEESNASQVGKRAAGKASRTASGGRDSGGDRVDLDSSILDHVDLSLTMDRKEYQKKLKSAQDCIRELEHEIHLRRVPVVILYEGWDAAGKGGNIRRLTQHLDPRGYEVAPVAAPNDVERAHHYLWRFWINMPKAGHITIFDRSWYGRVLVERVEGFCREEQWRRAYREINEMEQHMTHFGAVLLKFWLHIDPDEQLRRFEERKKLAYKQWKITDEDWRNRKKWPLYKEAVEEMLMRTSTPYAPWTIVESNCKWHARVKAIHTVCGAIRARLG
jgi:polyphosphate:AMP phosphotransferase